MDGFGPIARAVTGHVTFEWRTWPGDQQAVGTRGPTFTRSSRGTPPSCCLLFACVTAPRLRRQSRSTGFARQKIEALFGPTLGLTQHFFGGSACVCSLQAPTEKHESQRYGRARGNISQGRQLPTKTKRKKARDSIFPPWNCKVTKHTLSKRLEKNSFMKHANTGTNQRTLAIFVLNCLRVLSKFKDGQAIDFLVHWTEEATWGGSSGSIEPLAFCMTRFRPLCHGFVRTKATGPLLFGTTFLPKRAGIFTERLDACPFCWLCDILLAQVSE